MTESLGYSHEELLGKELWEIGLLKDEEASRAAFRELQAKGYIRYEHLPLETKEGQRREVEFVSNLYEEDARQVIQCNIRDITQRKRAEMIAKNETSRHAVELKKTVSERTAELRATIGELEAFSYSVSHDMRAPLRAMQGFSEILLQDYAARLDIEGIRYLKNIRVAALRMDALIQDVLNYGLVLRSEVKMEGVDLDKLVPHIIETYPPLHTGHAEIHIEGTLPTVLGHEASLAQCISNLLINAVKFVAPGTKARVKIWAEPQESAGAGQASRAESLSPRDARRKTVDCAIVRLWVEDNGIGIDPKDQERIFKMFERVSFDYEGTGIGLTIARKAMERIGGRIGVESALRQGSRFWLELRKVEGANGSVG
jgi:PAS domain S-box-containing protein